MSPPRHPCRKRPRSRQLHVSPSSKAPLAVLTIPPGPAQASAKQQVGRDSVLPPPDTDLVFLREGASSPLQVPGPAAASSEAPLQVRISPHSSKLHPALCHGAETKSVALFSYAGGPVLCPELGCDLASGETREGRCSRGVDSRHSLSDFIHVAAWLP